FHHRQGRGPQGDEAGLIVLGQRFYDPPVHAGSHHVVGEAEPLAIPLDTAPSQSMELASATAGGRRDPKVGSAAESMTLLRLAKQDADVFDRRRRRSASIGLASVGELDVGGRVDGNPVPTLRHPKRGVHALVDAANELLAQALTVAPTTSHSELS